ncbi:hydroxyacid dehydrogenase [Patescibacteria group bacterium]|nr:hydroxyacid dehydrogenase [Patescibacteria group bacterium]
MKKIVITHDLGLSSEDMGRLKSLGDVVVYDSRPSSVDEWLERVKGANIICSGISGLKDGYKDLKNVFISLPMVGYSYLDKEILEKNNIKVANSPGCNKDAVAEWIVGMVINLLRDLLFFVDNNSLPKDKAPQATRSLVDRKILILGKGNIGTRVGEICEALKMKVSFFKRGDNLIDKVKGQEIIVNCLSANDSSVNLLDENFFNALEKGIFFVSVSNNTVYNAKSMFKALDNGKIYRAAIDEGTMPAGATDDEYYQKLLNHPKILATPHIAYNTDYTDKLGNKIMIDNIEAYLNNKPINLIYS